ncbi:hypothetical protein [Soonwooa sp.]|uniref:hypothetical protein n=1 Tax=Soonwooa sp. TaxID=1938592 RepID=UPI00262AD015|nr:hypothetical protein [Soonwooa sp.]
MKNLLFLFCLLPFWMFSQKEIKSDSLDLKDSQGIYFDDYDNIYLYNKKNLSFTKYDSLGKKNAQLMLARPYRAQSISNPLNIVFFSENTQEIKLTDANLNDIQNIRLSNNFNFVRSAYVEDLQSLWLLDDSSKKLIQYNYRTNTTVNSFPFYYNMEDVLDMLVYENKVYVLKKDSFLVLNLRGEILDKIELNQPTKLKRDNETILVFTKPELIQYSTNKKVKKLSYKQDSEIVDKNKSGFLVRSKNKLYLYKPESENTQP